MLHTQQYDSSLVRCLCSVVIQLTSCSSIQARVCGIKDTSIVAGSYSMLACLCMILASQRCSEDYQLLPTLTVNIMLLLQTLVQGTCMWTAGVQ